MGNVRVIRRGIGMRGILRRVEAVEKHVAQAGFPSGGKVAPPKREGSGHKPFSTMQEIAQVAIWLDLGVPSKNIPARPFFLSLTREHVKKVEAVTKRKWIQVLKGTLSEEILLEMADSLIREIIKGIIDSNFEHNADSTIKKKGFDFPLIDRGQLINSLQVMVVRS